MNRLQILVLAIFLNLILSSSLLSQYDRDILSIRGGIYEKLITDFSGDTGVFKRDTSLLRGYRLNQGSKTISGNSGKLQFIASTCKIFNSNYEVMAGGENYNSVGPLVNEGWCKDNFDHSIENVFSVPVPKKDSLYYLIYFKYRIAPQLSSSKLDSLFYRTIDMSKQNGRGEVSNDEKLLYVDTSFNSETTAITRHDNGDDWWFIANTIEQKYFKFLADSSGVYLTDTSQVGTPFASNQLGSGQSTFSTSGDMFAYVEEDHGIRLFDFDQSTGEFSNYRVDSSIAISGRSLRRGVAFSGNDRFLYVNVGGFILYQYDLMYGDLSQKEVIWEYNQATDTIRGGFPLYLDKLQLEPDCKIYGAQPDGFPYFHIIHNPNGKGVESRFELGYETPAYTIGATITHPHWRTSTPYEDWCDTVMYTSTATPPFKITDDRWMIYPNPTTNELSVKNTNDLVTASGMRLVDQHGRLIKSFELDNDGIYTISLGELSRGIYFLHIIPSEIDSSGESLPVVKKIVKL